MIWYDGISNSFQSFVMGVDTCVDLDISQTVIWVASCGGKEIGGGFNI